MNLYIITILVFTIPFSLPGCSSKAYYNQQPELAQQTTASYDALGKTLGTIAAQVFQQPVEPKSPTPSASETSQGGGLFNIPEMDAFGDFIDPNGEFDVAVVPQHTVVQTGAMEAMGALEAILVAQERTRQVEAFTEMVTSVLMGSQHKVADPFGLSLGIK